MRVEQPLSKCLAIWSGNPARRCRLTELGGRAAVCRAERSAEVAVTREAEVQPDGGQVVVLSKKVQGPRQAQPQLIAIQGQPFDLLKDLREIYGRTAHLGANFI